LIVQHFVSALMRHCFLYRAPTANSIDQQREHRQLATIASIGADTISFVQQFPCPPEKPIGDFIKSLHALMPLHEGQIYHSARHAKTAESLLLPPLRKILLPLQQSF